MAGRRTVEGWLVNAQAELLRGEPATALATLRLGLAAHPESADLRRAQAGTLLQAGHVDAAESVLRAMLVAHPGDAAAAFTLARALKEQARVAGAAHVLRACFAEPANQADADLTIQAIELLDDCDRKADAAALARAGLAANPGDARLHAYAGMLLMQLGAFESARQHFLSALDDDRAWEWHVAYGLSAAQRYAAATHPDVALFHTGLERRDLSALARAELHFALGKVYDDSGDYATAAQEFRAGNQLRYALTHWSSKAWRRAVAGRLAAIPTPAIRTQAVATTPIFIVGVPRSGTTLLAELLSRYSRVCNRGELPWMAQLAAEPALNGHVAPADMDRAAASYAAQLHRDDDDDARWFIDKQPLNFSYVDLMLALFPSAKILYCRRSARDTALSLWTQCFLEDTHGYSYDVHTIALVLRDCKRLMAHWNRYFAASIRAVCYADLVAAPERIVAELAQWIGLPACAPDVSSARGAISTASLWQARQPVYTSSVGRWRHYAGYVPELLELPE